MSPFPFVRPHRYDISMFDCPEQIHTSPKSTLVIATRSSSDVQAATSYGPPAANGVVLTSHFPRASAFVFDVNFASPSREISTRTACPGSASPQIGVWPSRWRTAWSEKTLAILNVPAFAPATDAATAAPSTIRLTPLPCLPPSDPNMVISSLLGCTYCRGQRACLST